MNISLVTIADLPVLTAIEKSAAQAFLETDDLAWLAEGEVQSLERHRILMYSGTNWAARNDCGEPVGFISAEETGDELHIWELSVHRDYQGSGIGRALVKKAIESARTKHLSAVTLTTFRDVPWNAPFYKRLGFRTLELDNMPERLKGILEAERAHGLPPDRRCAMAMSLLE
jgi:ribosomal protein S18 acetylase RimI-like enzyme